MSATVRTFNIKTLRLLAIAAASSVVILFLSLTVLASVIDERGRQRELAVTSAEFLQVVHDMQEVLGATANWDPAMLNLDNRFNPQWAEQNLVSALENDVSGRLVMVLGADDRIMLLRERARPVDAERTAAVRRAATDLIGRIRAQEGADTRQSKQSVPRTSADWVLQSATVLLQGRPTLLNAGLVGTDIGAVSQLHAHAPIIIYGSDVQKAIVPMLTARLLLRDAMVSVGDTTERMAGLPLRDAAGRVTATLGWTAGRPGRDLLLGALVPLLIIVGFLSFAVLTAYRQGISGARALLESESRAQHLASHDGLTGLPNRRLLDDRLLQAVGRAARQGGDVAVLLLDLDRFKLINDTYGHCCGDELIQEVGRRLQKAIRTSDTCARLGGDEFAIIVEGCSADQAAISATRLAKAVAEPMQLTAAMVHTSVSIGISISRNGESQAADLLRQADMALYKAKEGRNRVNFFEMGMDQAQNSRRGLETDLRAALKAGTLAVVYQPQFDGNRIIGVEALARWTHEQRGAISPALFVALAEDCGLIEDLGAFVMGRAFADSRRWPDLKVAINISATQLRVSSFMPQLKAQMREHGIDAHNFELEITEGVLMADDLPLRDTLAALRQMGFTLSLDDFGTGYSSLSYLRRFPIDKIKIDRTFIVGIADDPVAQSIISAIVGLADAMDLDLIAEGVETEEQKRRLEDAGCSKIQGFLMGRPVSAEAITALVATDNAIKATMFPVMRESSLLT